MSASSQTTDSMPGNNEGNPSLSTGSAMSEMVDSTHPHYLHPSDYPGMNLVSSVFDGRGYGGWRRAVVIALSAKNKIGFIDGTLAAPNTDSLLQKSWVRCNDMVLSWLLNSLSKEIAESVLYSHSARQLWNDLEDRFGQASGAKLFQLQKELNAVVQGNTSISSYFTKMKSLWDELDALNTFSACICECVCGAKEKGLKAHQDERLLQFLMGLNVSFVGVRSNILLSSPLPSIGQAYSLVIQDEKQREIHAAPVYPGDSASFMAVNQGGGRRYLDKGNQDRQVFNPRRSTEVCAYCKKPGHSVDRCYRVHGFPSDFKFTKQKKFQVTAQANTAYNQETEKIEKVWDVKGMSPENVEQLMHLFQQFQMNQQNAGPTDAITSTNCAVNEGMSKRAIYKALFESSALICVSFLQVFLLKHLFERKLGQSRV